jgi:LmbE family N-acetylglucosaminyl deacetylase
MKIMIMGAHPDDPESGCGGLAAQCAAENHEVHFIYATAYRKGRSCFGRPEKEVRTQEARAACDVLGVRGDVWDFAHEGIDVNPANIKRVTAYLETHRPDLLVGHWPVDTHPDHRAFGTLTLSAFLAADIVCDFYFFEVMTGRQSIHFQPTHYVDISAGAEQKHRALREHRSQDGEAVWRDHERMHGFRGWECGVERAEAYIRVDRGKTVGRTLPFHVK